MSAGDGRGGWTAHDFIRGHQVASKLRRTSTWRRYEVLVAGELVGEVAGGQMSAEGYGWTWSASGASCGGFPTRGAAIAALLGAVS